MDRESYRRVGEAIGELSKYRDDGELTRGLKTRYGKRTVGVG